MSSAGRDVIKSCRAVGLTNRLIKTTKRASPIELLTALVESYQKKRFEGADD